MKVLSQSGAVLEFSYEELRVLRFVLGRVTGAQYKEAGFDWGEMRAEGDEQNDIGYLMYETVADLIGEADDD